MQCESEMRAHARERWREMGNCSCGSRRGAASTKWKVISSDGTKVLGKDMTEMDARLLSSRNAGSRVRPA